MIQLPLQLAPPPAPTLDNFIVGANGGALAALRELLRDTDSATAIYLYGESGSGKSHLLRAIANAWQLRMRDPLQYVVVDDVQTLDDDVQIEVFDAFNRTRLNGGAMLTAGDKAPRELRVREDLRTRLGAGLVFQLHALSDEQKREAMQQHAQQRGMRMNPEVLNYLLTRLRRDMPTLMAVLDAIDNYSLATKRPITVPLVREALQTLQ
jgi:DnaA family protein